MHHTPVLLDLWTRTRSHGLEAARTAAAGWILALGAAAQSPCGGGTQIPYGLMIQGSIATPGQPNCHTSCCTAGDRVVLGSLCAGQELALKGGEQRSINGLSTQALAASDPGKVLRWIVTYDRREESIELEFLRKENIAADTAASADEAFRCWARGPHADRIPQGVFRLSCEDKYTSLAGGSAGAAFATLMRSFSDGFQIDSEAAVTGDISAEGRILVVGGTFEKSRGALMGRCSRVVVPLDNYVDLVDSAILYGPEAAAAIEIYGAATIDEVIGVVRCDRDSCQTRASELFAGIRDFSKGSLKKGALPRSVELAQLAHRILELAPRHLSAALIRDWAERRLPSKLSLRRSMHEALRLWDGGLAEPAAESSEEVESPRSIDAVHIAHLDSHMRSLRLLRPKLHANTGRLASRIEAHFSQVLACVRIREKRRWQEQRIEDLDAEIQRVSRRYDHAQRTRRPQADLILLANQLVGLQGKRARSVTTLESYESALRYELAKANSKALEVGAARDAICADLASAEAIVHRR